MAGELFLVVLVSSPSTPTCSFPPPFAHLFLPMKQQYRTEEVLMNTLLLACLNHISVTIMTMDNLAIMNSDLVL
eukprot:7360466-Heterocapsa_arctica.AAC.1